MPIRCLVQFAQTHPFFRLPELLSVSELYGMRVSKPDSEDWDVNYPFWVCDFESEEEALLLAKRCILIKTIIELYGSGDSYDEVHAQTKQSETLWQRYVADTSFRVLVTSYNHTIPKARQTDIVESFAYMDLQGKIDLKNAELVLVCIEEYADEEKRKFRHKHDGDGDCKHIYFGRLILNGTARSLVNKFDVKKRAYFGNTSMDAEISLLMANQALAAPGKLMYDPFVGTGSMLYTSSHFGALVYGSDIDGRQMRGKGKFRAHSEKTYNQRLYLGQIPGVMVSARQYEVAQRVLDLCTFDITRNPWRCGDLFDAIITDPPYGVRAGAKRIGRTEAKQARVIRRATKRKAANQDTVPSEPTGPYIPATKPYEMSELVHDLVFLARYLLKPGGRLVFFLPTVTEEYQDVDIEDMLCDGMKVIANSLQDFGTWGRRLITIKKVTSEKVLPPHEVVSAVKPVENAVHNAHVPAHRDFRDKYFKGFRKDESQMEGDIRET